MSTSEAKDLSKESPTASGSILDKIHDVVESELYGKSRAIIRRNLDSMISNSSVKLKEKRSITEK